MRAPHVVTVRRGTGRSIRTGSAPGGERPRCGARLRRAASAGASASTSAARFVTPGLVDTHHHLSPTLTRSPGAAGGLYGVATRSSIPVWARIDASDTRPRARALAELALSGCAAVSTTTTSSPAAGPGSSRPRCRRPASSACGSSPPASMDAGACSVGGFRRTGLVEELDAGVEDTERLAREARPRRRRACPDRGGAVLALLR